jgi:hypothetical protein
MDSSGSEYAAVAVSFKHGNERPGFTECGKVRRFKTLKDSVPFGWTVYQVTFRLNNKSYGGHMKTQEKNIA